MSDWVGPSHAISTSKVAGLLSSALIQSIAMPIKAEAERKAREAAADHTVIQTAGVAAKQAEVMEPMAESMTQLVNVQREEGQRTKLIIRIALATLAFVIAGVMVSVIEGSRTAPAPTPTHHVTTVRH